MPRTPYELAPATVGVAGAIVSSCNVVGVVTFVATAPSVSPNPFADPVIRVGKDIVRCQTGL